MTATTSLYPGRPCRDLSHRDFGHLTVVDYAGKDSFSREWWLCRCDRCLERKPVRADHLRSGSVKSCGGVGCRTNGRRRRAS